MTQVSYIIGIDLGTTNSTVAFAQLAGEEPLPAIEQYAAIPQIVAVGEVAP